IEYIQPNFIYRALGYNTNDPYYDQQWGMIKIRVNEAWNITKGSKSVIVAVIDTGVDYNHEDLKEAIWKNTREIPGNGSDDDNNGFVDDVMGWDFNENDNDPMDVTGSVMSGENPGHGTHCAGNVGAVGNNGTGISGVAQNVTIMPLRFLGKDGSGTTAMAIKAIRYAIDNGANILSNSWGSQGSEGTDEDKALKDMIDECLKKDILFIAAAGNHSVNNDTSDKASYPASFPNDNIISVAASTQKDTLASFSCYGPKTVDLAAPGVAIMSTVPGNEYQAEIIPGLASWDGTSMAAPHVAGVAALLKSLKPALTYSQIKESILGSVDKLSSLKGKMISSGRLNAEAALKYAASHF
ncbi:MAG: S8 family serine peptidase, partial [Oligoflexales bacterium]|nr:S8 family serine peptidase [Oligoflexales bacterium]